jgi:hypothetical protein
MGSDFFPQKNIEVTGSSLFGSNPGNKEKKKVKLLGQTKPKKTVNFDVDPVIEEVRP